MDKQKLADLKELFLEISKKFEENGEIKSLDDIFEIVQQEEYHKFETKDLLAN